MSGQKHFLLFYEFASDYLQRRTEYRNEHLRIAWEAHERGELLIAGAYADPADGGLLLFACDTAEAPLRFAAADPYVTNGLVVRHYVRAWTTVVGKDAITPLHPAR